MIVKDNLLVVEGQVSVDEYTGGFRMSADKLYTIEQARAAFGTRLVIDVDAELAGNGFVAELKQILEPATPRACPVYLRYQNQGAAAEILLGQEWRVVPTGAVLDHLARLAGAEHVRLIY